MDNYFTVADVAQKLGITTGRVRQLILEGRFPTSRVGQRLLLISSDAVRRFRPRPTGRPKKKSRKP